jgi:hypothetical protein
VQHRAIARSNSSCEVIRAIGSPDGAAEGDSPSASSRAARIGGPSGLAPPASVCVTDDELAALSPSSSLYEDRHPGRGGARRLPCRAAGSPCRARGAALVSGAWRRFAKASRVPRPPPGGWANPAG